MNSDFLSPFLMHLVAQTPVLLVYLIGMLLAVIYWSRCPVPCLLTLIASGLLLLTTVATTFLQMQLLTMQVNNGWTAQQTSFVFSALSIGGAFIRASALALLVTAVFVGRGRSEAPYRRRQDDVRVPLLEPGEETRIQRERSS